MGRNSKPKMTIISRDIIIHIAVRSRRKNPFDIIINNTKYSENNQNLHTRDVRP